jgi:RecB family exonuclease
MRELSYTSGLAAQNGLAQLVVETKKLDALGQVTLIVDSNHQALQFRRQLVRSLARGGHCASLVAFSAFTKLDVASILARIAEIKWDPQEFKSAKQDVLIRVLNSHGEVFGNLARHPESLATLIKYIDAFDWVELNDTTVNDLTSAGEFVTTKISLQLLQVAKEVQEQLRTSGKLTPANIIRLLEDSPSESFLRQAKKSLGKVMVVAADYPSTLADLLDQLLGSDAQIKINLIRGDSMRDRAEVQSFPDPETEAKAVVREVAKRIAEGSAIENFAVLYTNASQYADLLENEFDQAQITWNGMSTESASLSLPAKATQGYLGVANSIFQTGTFTRVDFLDLLRTSSITSQDAKYGTVKFVRFLNRNGLFNEVSNWELLLHAMAAQIPALEKELEDLAVFEAEQEEIDDVTSKLNQARTARSLEQLIRELMSSVERLAKSVKYSDLASSIWQEVNEFFPQLAQAKMPVDRLAFEKMEEFFGGQHQAPLSSRPEIIGALSQLGQGVLLRLGQLKMQHGELARGVYVGPVSQNGALYFENLWVIGAGEGMLPPQIAEDPIFPDSLKELFTQQNSFEFKTVAARAAEVEANFFAVATGAKNLTISYPRGGTLSKSEGMPSAWLGMLTSASVTDFQAAFEFRLGEVGAISTTDLQSKKSAALRGATAVSKQLLAAVWFASPQVTEFAGNLEGKASAPLIDFDKVSLSASSVEKFLKCGHNFFTVKILGLSDTDEPNSIDEIRPTDFGKAVHAAFERLLKEFPLLNPSFGERYSDEAIAKFRELFNEECELLVARGQSGWPPLFESRKRGFIDQLENYFSIEHQARAEVYVAPSDKRGQFKPMSKANLLKPQNAEFEFDKTGNGLLQVPVQAEGFPPETLKFKGLIDRVDVSADREHVGVIDFKTGSVAYVDKRSAVQDLLYEHAIRRNSNFLGVTKVSSRYVFLSKTEKDSGLVDLRTEREPGVFLDLINGGLSGKEYASALVENKLAAEFELQEKLKLLVTAAHKGTFLTHDVQGSSKSFSFCRTCKKLGHKTIFRLSSIAHQQTEPTQAGSEEGQE